MEDKNLKDQKSDSRKEIIPLKAEDVKEGINVRVAASVGIVRFIIDTISERGLAGCVTKDEKGKLMITVGVHITADAESFTKYEQVFKDENNDTKE